MPSATASPGTTTPPAPAPSTRTSSTAPWGTFRVAVSSGSGSSWGGGGITPDASPKKIQIHHRAGPSRYGGSSYIDSMLLREKDTRDSSDAIQPPYAAADSTRDQTLYYVQNWRADVVALLNTDGRAMEHVRYTPYGKPRRFLTSPIDIAYDNGDFLPPEGTPNVALPNAGVGEGDYNAFFRAYFPESGSPQLAADVANDDGTPLPPFGPLSANNGVSEGDYNLFFNLYFDGWDNGSENAVSTAAIGNTIGYAGYEHDPILLTPPALSATPGEGYAAYYHVRHRVYDANLGRWTRRDPLGYVDGMGLYEYVRSRPVVDNDPSGLAITIPASVFGCLVGAAIPAISAAVDYFFTGTTDFCGAACDTAIGCIEGAMFASGFSIPAGCAVGALAAIARCACREALHKNFPSRCPPINYACCVVQAVAGCFAGGLRGFQKRGEIEVEDIPWFVTLMATLKIVNWSGCRGANTFLPRSPTNTAPPVPGTPPPAPPAPGVVPGSRPATPVPYSPIGTRPGGFAPPSIEESIKSNNPRLCTGIRCS